MVKSINSTVSLIETETELDSKQSYQIARGYHLLAVAVGDYRFENWKKITPAERKQLEDFEWTLAQFSSDFNYKSIILLMNSKETLKAVTNITDTTEKMEKAIKRLKKIDRVISIATAAFTLGGAIISGNPVAIGSAVISAVGAIESNKEEENDEMDA